MTDEDSRPTLADDFDAWVAVHGTSVLRLAIALAGGRAPGEDLAQEALARVFARWGKVSRMENPLAYVRRTVVNLHVSWWRKIGQREVAVSPVGASAVPAHTETDSHPDARASEVWQLCRRLPNRQQVAVVLRFYEDMSYDEIGALMGTSPTTARSQVSRALQSLRTWTSSSDYPNKDGG